MGRYSHPPGELKPLVVLCVQSCSYYRMAINTKTGFIDEKIAIRPIGKYQINSFYRTFGQYAPKVVPSAWFDFDPAAGRQRPDLESDPMMIYPCVPGAPLRTISKKVYDTERPSIGDLNSLETFCPKTTALVRWVMGGSGRFASLWWNWLAYIIQTGNKTQTAWVLTGQPGTGKGTIYRGLLQPLFGNHFNKRTIEDMNTGETSWLRWSQMAWCIEDIPDSKPRRRFKDWITEPLISVRHEKSQTDFEIVSRCNFMLAVENITAVDVDNKMWFLPPKQHEPILDNLPWVDGHTAPEDHIAKERPQVVRFLRAFRVSVRDVKVPEMHKTTAAAVDVRNTHDFSMAVIKGDIGYWIDLLRHFRTGLGARVFRVNTYHEAQRVLEGFLDDACHPHRLRRTVVHWNKLLLLYNCTIKTQGAPMRREALKSAIHAEGLPIQPKQHEVPHRRGRSAGVKIVWSDAAHQIAKECDL